MKVSDEGARQKPCLWVTPHWLLATRRRATGHAEQNILHFLHRRHEARGRESWLPTHGAASRPVCPDICPPIIRAAAGDGRSVQVCEPNSSYLKFYWPDNHLKKK
ncbi:hypothetical protein ACIOMM_08520 [Streptomyces sp. NPDC087908]|uniref:hypothetical protein n=1 Tax=Streptomyces sp. NPDC087908 TaxID=3365820 RepID=UPI0037FD9239